MPGPPLSSTYYTALYLPNYFSALYTGFSAPRGQELVLLPQGTEHGEKKVLSLWAALAEEITKTKAASPQLALTSGRDPHWNSLKTLFTSEQ